MVLCMWCCCLGWTTGIPIISIIPYSFFNFFRNLQRRIALHCTSDTGTAADPLISAGALLPLPPLRLTS